MLDRKAKLTVLAFLLLMLASAIWLVGYTGRWSGIPFFLPACVLFVVGVCSGGWRARKAISRPRPDGAGFSRFPMRRFAPDFS
jgi:uncharacterized membrane protein YqjE